MSNAITTTHNLDFEVAPWVTPEFTRFRIGTCDGLWAKEDRGYAILSVVNDQPGNGHLDDVFEWFEFAAKRDNTDLLVLEIMNESFKKHLTTKRGFVPIDNDNLIKKFS